MRVREIVGITVVVLAVIGVYITLIPTHNSNLNIPHASVRLVVDVYRDGSHVYHVCKDGDIILKNFASAIINTMLMGNHDPDSDDKMVNVNNWKIWSNDICESCTAQIVLGSNTGRPTPLDYVIPNPTATFPIQDADAVVVGNDVVLDIMGSYTVQNDVNVTEIGLQSNVISNGGAPVLLFHDVLPQALQLKAGDTIAVHYYVYFDNP